MATDLEVAQLVSDAYAPGTTIDARKWRIVASDKGWFGFESTLYQRNTSAQNGMQCAPASAPDAVLVFRGSEKPSTWSGAQDWFLNDTYIAGGNMPPQAVKAITLAKQYKTNYPNLLLAGHSLGGALAIIASAHSGLKAVTFNAPGVREACVQSSVIDGFAKWRTIQRILETAQRCISGSDVRNYRSDGDVVSNQFFLKQSGAMIILSVECKAYDVLCLHGMEGIQAILAAPPAAFNSAW